MTDQISGVVPHLAIIGGKATDAIDFYTRAFGAEEVMRMPADDGVRLMHAHLRINGADVFLCDDFPEYRGGAASPPPSAVTMHVHVDDVDAWWKRAVDAGATVTMELADQFWGDRYGQVKDPFGHSWSLASPVKK